MQINVQWNTWQETPAEDSPGFHRPALVTSCEEEGGEERGPSWQVRARILSIIVFFACKFATQEPKLRRSIEDEVATKLQAGYKYVLDMG